MGMKFLLMLAGFGSDVFFRMTCLKRKVYII